MRLDIRTVLALLLVLPLFAMAGESKPYSLTFSTIILEDYNEGQNNIGSITSIRQDRHGFMWLGGKNGLARFDGHSIKLYTHDENNEKSITGDHVRSIVFDKDNVMWVGTIEGLSRYNEELDRFDNVILEKDGFSLRTGIEAASIAFTEDNSLVIGSLDGLVIYDQNRDNISIYSHEPGNPLSLSSNKVRAICVDKNNIVWIGTDKGLDYLDLADGVVRRYEMSLGTNRWEGDVRSIFEDSLGQLWVGFFKGGVRRIDQERKNIDPMEKFGLSQFVGDVFEIIEGQDGQIWIAIDHKGLLRYDPKTGEHAIFDHEPADLTSVASNQVQAVFEDQRKGIWVGHFNGKINYFNHQKTLFKNYTDSGFGRNRLVHKSILTVNETKDGMIWIGSEGGINTYNPNTESFSDFGYIGIQADGKTPNPILGIVEDEEEFLWVGTWLGGLYRFDRKTFESRNYSSGENGLGILKGESVWELHIDKKDRLWVGSDGTGLHLYNREKDEFTQFQHEFDNVNSLSSSNLRKIISAKDGKLWIGTTEGLDTFIPEKNEFIRFEENPGYTRLISDNYVLAALQVKSGEIWIGTGGNGINIYSQEGSLLGAIGLEQGLQNLVVSSLIEESDGTIWAGTLNGLAQIDPVSRKVTLTIKKRHGLVSNYINRDALYYSSDKRIYVGTIEGLSIFDPLKIPQPEIRGVSITDFKVHHKSVEAGGEVLPTIAHLTSDIVLNHHQNSFSFDFSSLNFRNSRLARYKYRLLGYHNDWNSLNKNNSAIYTNIDPGRYTFEVTEMKVGNDAEERITRVNIQIKSPLWARWWAYLIYIITFLVMVYWAVYIKIHKLRLEKEYQTKTNEKLVRLDKLKDAVLANTSHELRTPIHGIIGIAESLEDSIAKSDAGEIHTKIEMIISSGKRLSRLVNDILDFSTISEGALQIKMGPENVYSAVEESLLLTAPLAHSKNIELFNNIKFKSIMVNVDRDRFRQILINLISNGIKYTEAGSVSVSCFLDNQYLVIHIRDTGIGISREDQEHIFNAFSQVDNSAARKNEGSGLGLALTKELVELHGGNLWVDSQVGKGSCFSFSVKRCMTCVSGSRANDTGKKWDVKEREAQEIKETEVEEEKDSATLESSVEDKPKVEAKLDKSTELASEEPIEEKDASANVLIVDDDPVNRMVLDSMLKLDSYRVIEADNGQTAIDIVNESNQEPIDLIILDLMMPGMTGFDVCKVLRKTHAKYELPIMILTARPMDEVLSEGQEVGANEFLAKPISKDELLPRVASQLRMLKEMRSVS